MSKTTLNTDNFINKPRKDGTRNERYYEVTHSCGHTSHLRIHDARNAVTNNGVCRTCHSRKAAAKGYAACVRKYGAEFPIKFVIKHQLANPSKPEQQIMKWLTELNVGFDRQVPINLGGYYYIADFMLSNGKVIEASGGYWHAKDKGEKDAKLASAMLVLFLTDELVMKNPAEALRILTEYVHSTVI